MRYFTKHAAQGFILIEHIASAVLHTPHLGTISYPPEIRAAVYTITNFPGHNFTHMCTTFLCSLPKLA